VSGRDSARAMIKKNKFEFEKKNSNKNYYIYQIKENIELIDMLVKSTKELIKSVIK